MVMKKISVDDEEFNKFDITEKQFGPVMLSRLGKGLYKNPLHCGREYIQNAVDGINRFDRECPDDPIDKTIRILAEGDTIIFHDNGIGMNREDILIAISFGVSHKEKIYDAGFLGIGIFSGSAIADRLRIYTSKKGEERSLVFEINFKHIEEHYKNYKSGLSLLRDATQFQELDENEKYHYCTAILYVNKHYQDLLKEDGELRRYISNVCPVDFPNDFEHRDGVIEFYKKYRIIDQIFDIHLNKKPVYRRFPNNVREPIIKEIRHKGKLLAAYWSCENKERAVIMGDKPEEDDEIRYLTYRWRNFLIDDPLRRDYAARELYGGRPGLMKNYFGDIHILDLEEIEPDLERTGIRATEAYRQFKNNITDRRNPNNIMLLYDEAHDVSKQSVLMEESKKAEETAEDTEKNLESMELDSLFRAKVKVEEQKEKILKRKKESRGRAYNKLSTPEKQEVEGGIKKLETVEKKISEQITSSMEDKTPFQSVTFDTKIKIKISRVLAVLRKHLKNYGKIYNAILKDIEMLVKGG